MEKKLRQLHERLVSNGFDKHSYDEFKANFSGNPDKQRALHERLVAKGFDSKPFEEFQANFFAVTPTEGAAKKKSGWLIRWWRATRDGYSRYA